MFSPLWILSIVFNRLEIIKLFYESLYKILKIIKYSLYTYDTHKLCFMLNKRSRKVNNAVECDSISTVLSEIKVIKKFFFFSFLKV